MDQLNENVCLKAQFKYTTACSTITASEWSCWNSGPRISYRMHKQTDLHPSTHYEQGGGSAHCRSVNAVSSERTAVRMDVLVFSLIQLLADTSWHTMYIQLSFFGGLTNRPAFFAFVVGKFCTCVNDSVSEILVWCLWKCITNMRLPYLHQYSVSWLSSFHYLIA